MSSECQSKKSVEKEPAKAPNFFQRMFQKLDDRMKEKADESASCCCCNEENKTAENTEKCC